MQMKKLLGVLLTMLLVLVGCGNNADEDVKGATYKIGTASLTHQSGTDAGEEDGKFALNTYFAHVVLSEDGKIVDVYIDVAQNNVTFDANDKLTGFSGQANAPTTKKELGDDYGMTRNPAAIAEWYVQMDSFEQYITGMTVEEVLNIPVYQKDDAHQAVPDVEDLKSSVTITIENYQAVVKMAADNAVTVENVDKVGTRSITTAAQTGIEILTDFATIALDADGKIVYAALDTMQSKATLEGGVITLTDVVTTKKQLGDDYGMMKNPTAVAEWDDQIAAFEAHFIGKTVSEVVGMPTYVKDENHDRVADVEDLKSTVTINIGQYLDVVDKAAKNAEAVK